MLVSRGVRSRHTASSAAGRWTDDPEWRTTGVSYAFGGGKWIGERPASGYRVCDASHWAFAGLGVHEGDTFGAQQRLIGYEFDGAPAQSDLHLLAEAPVHDWPVADGSGELSASAHATLGIRQADGMVFTTSTVDWARVLAAGDRVVAGVTHNVLRFLG